jgi:hypothetical protein
MGTWAVQQDKIPGLIEELNAFLKKAYSIAGDDQFFDCIGSAQNRLKEMASHEWRKCNNGLVNLVPVGDEGVKEEQHILGIKEELEKANKKSLDKFFSNKEQL